MQALVTGGSGFIGSEVIRQLLSRGIKVRALLRKTSSRKNLKDLDYETVEGDLADYEALKRGVAGVDYVFHLAGAITAKQREEYFRHNSEGTANLAKACAEVNPNLKRFVYVSSLAASGPARSITPRCETDTDAPISFYGESKLGGERELDRFAKSFAYTVLRPPAVYGPRDRGVFQFVKVVNSGVIPIFPAKNDAREKYYSLIHVEDLVRGIVLGGLAPNQGKKEIFFLCDDPVYSWSQVISSMATALGKNPMRLRLPRLAWTGLAMVFTAAGMVFRKSFPLTLDKLKELEPDYWICSNALAKQKLGFKPQYGLTDGMAHTIAWYKQNGWI